MKLILLLAFLLIGLHATDIETLLKEVQTDNKERLAKDSKREKAFANDLYKAKETVAKIKAELAEEKKKTQALKKTFEEQKEQIQHSSETLAQRSVSLKDLFAITQQEARDLASFMKSSMTSTQIHQRESSLQKLTQAQELPTIEELKRFWQLYFEEIIASGQIISYDTSVISTHGEKNNEKVTRIGIFNAFNSQEYLSYDESLQSFVKLMRQPSEVDLISPYIKSTQTYAPILVDPTRGVLLNMLKERASIAERIHQGGVIGYIILALGALTLLFALVKYTLLFITERNMKLQLQTKEAAQNPISRLLDSFEKHKNKEIAVIESKIDAVITKEIPHIQAGLPMIKLVAAVAPLLGLLGTVTGMIETFQSITLFGTGDPKLMAGGISQALMTTVLGLVVAIPILFIYNSVQAKSRRIVEILTQQSSALIAKHLEMVEVAQDADLQRI